ncbi:hypothetical protein ACIQXW_23390 [Lysinibacillus sp. NPDC097162]|uniref:hypothetical protein n=1 Tax=Lysinibacillus sp. NPDC097162 TaxID=3364140 RepID=UPI0037FBAAD9
MNNKSRKPWFKRWQVWAGVFVFLVILGIILPEPPDDKNAEVVKKESNIEVKSEKTHSKTEPEIGSPLTKDEVLENFEVEPSVEPFINGTFTFVGNRTDTADYYSLADTDKFRNASIIFKDGQIARLKLIPIDAKNVKKLFEDFGIAGDPRKLNGAAGFYEVALIPKYWTQNIEKYPYDKD